MTTVIVTPITGASGKTYESPNGRRNNLTMTEKGKVVDSAPHKEIVMFGLVNPQLLLGMLIVGGIGIYCLLRTTTLVNLIKSLPRPMKWAYAAWMPESALFFMTRVGAVIFIVGSLAFLGMFIAEQIDPSIATR